MVEGEWQTATSRRRRKGGAAATAFVERHAARPPTPSKFKCAQPPTQRQVHRWCSLVNDAARELQAAPFWRHLTAQLGSLPPHCALTKLQHMVVYGLGSLEQAGAVHIRFQLAAAKLLAVMLPLCSEAQAYDPVFTPLDHATLAHCSIKVLPHDEGGRRVVATPTLFFMPHCEVDLTDALLAANLEAGTLHNVVVLGNRFSGYQVRCPLLHGSRQQQQHKQHHQRRRHQHEQQQQQHRLQQHEIDTMAPATAPSATMLRLCECSAAQELPVQECGFPVASAFNDLGLHWFPPDWQQRLSKANDSLATGGTAVS